MLQGGVLHSPTRNLLRRSVRNRMFFAHNLGLEVDSGLWERAVTPSASGPSRDIAIRCAVAASLNCLCELQLTKSSHSLHFAFYVKGTGIE